MAVEVAVEVEVLVLMPVLHAYPGNLFTIDAQVIAGVLITPELSLNNENPVILLDWLIFAINA